jgi:hypothetical protein
MENQLTGNHAEQLIGFASPYINSWALGCSLIHSELMPQCDDLECSENRDRKVVGTNANSARTMCFMVLDPLQQQR